MTKAEARETHAYLLDLINKGAVTTHKRRDGHCFLTVEIEVHDRNESLKYFNFDPAQRLLPSIDKP